jgi:hypothetical protein
MAGSLTRYGESYILKLAFKGQGTPPQTLFIGLATTNTPGAVFNDSMTLLNLADSSSGIQEVNDGNYNRQIIEFYDPIVGVDNKTGITNDGNIQFGPWLADSLMQDGITPLPVTHCFITDAVTGTSGNIIAWMTLDNSKNPTAGDMLVFYDGDIRFTLD